MRAESAKAHSPGQIEATPWVLVSSSHIRPESAKAYNTCFLCLGLSGHTQLFLGT